MDTMLQYVTLQFVGQFGHGDSPMCQGVPHELGHYMAPSWLSQRNSEVVTALCRSTIRNGVQPGQPGRQLRLARPKGGAATCTGAGDSWGVFLSCINKDGGYLWIFLTFVDIHRYSLIFMDMYGFLWMFVVDIT